ncbi:MAG: nitronate monooxygenase [Thermoleophilaceae bacterium]|jgi:NAD(P)H-dependent flavin oxidoreductase YrpB (nitropropane dioxygenase family)|nr:nitronate monooxygenase [Thermoleophilaceae bacterium]MEA2457981.1 nitronate monooxygenase [Thermoleophilaceae bacterium]
MASNESFTGLVGCRLPLQLASLGGPVGTPALAAAVSEAGGLGMIPNPSSAAEVEELVASARERTDRPVGVGFLMPFLSRDALQVAAARADVVEFFYADPDPDLVRAARAHGARAAWQVGSAAEALAAAGAGCDYVVVQGIEAGGHVRGTQPIDAVLAETLGTVDVPVVAAGGVGTAERLAELLTAGASAVRVGTRFVAAEESDAHPEYVTRLIAASADDTVLTEAFGVGWPDAPHRVLRAAVRAAEELDGPLAGTLGDGEIPRFAPVPPTREVRGQIAAMALYAGQSVGEVTRAQPAAEIVAELTAAI